MLKQECVDFIVSFSVYFFEGDVLPKKLRILFQNLRIVCMYIFRPTHAKV